PRGSGRGCTVPSCRNPGRLRHESTHLTPGSDCSLRPGGAAPHAEDPAPCPYASDSTTGALALCLVDARYQPNAGGQVRAARDDVPGTHRVWNIAVPVAPELILQSLPVHDLQGIASRGGLLVGQLQIDIDGAHDSPCP